MNTIQISPNSTIIVHNLHHYEKLIQINAKKAVALKCTNVGSVEKAEFGVVKVRYNDLFL